MLLSIPIGFWNILPLFALFVSLTIGVLTRLLIPLIFSPTFYPLGPTLISHYLNLVSDHPSASAHAIIRPRSFGFFDMDLKLTRARFIITTSAFSQRDFVLDS